MSPARVRKLRDVARAALRLGRLPSRVRARWQRRGRRQRLAGRMPPCAHLAVPRVQAQVLGRNGDARRLEVPERVVRVLRVRGPGRRAGLRRGARGRTRRGAARARRGERGEALVGAVRGALRGEDVHARRRKGLRVRHGVVAAPRAQQGVDLRDVGEQAAQRVKHDDLALVEAAACHHVRGGLVPRPALLAHVHRNLDAGAHRARHERHRARRPPPHQTLQPARHQHHLAQHLQAAGVSPVTAAVSASCSTLTRVPR